MPLAEKLNTPTRRQPGTPCSVAELLAKLNNDDRAALHAALDSRQSSSEIYWALRDEGHTVGKQTIGRHRRGDCRCAQ